jgi:carboxymethylenebutenolidase
MTNTKAIFSTTLPLFILICNISNAGESLVAFKDHADDSPITTEAAKRPPIARVSSESVIYGQTGDQKHVGYLSQPDKDKTKSALIVIHEWWGLNEDIHLMTDQLAALGYLALAVDLYDGKTANGVREAFQLSTNLSKNEEGALANLRQAYDYLEKELNTEKIGIIGWCLGGKWSLRGALMLPEKIDATVIYYGSLVNDKQKLAALEMPIIGFVGTKDRLHQQFIEFDKNLKELEKDSVIHIYDGAKHAFANASGIAYEESAAEDSWKKTVDFLNKHLD